MLLEIRRYTCHPGQRDAWVKYFEEKIAPFQTSKGMNILGSFIDEEDENGFVWLRRFDDEAHRVELYAAVYEDEEWKTNISPDIPTMMDRSKIVVTRVEPLASSAIQ
jgi:hypothetical protein